MVLEKNSFNALRLIAALLVFHTHHYALNGVQESRLPWFNTPYSGIGVGMFFAISGYLVAKSANRDPEIWSFLWKRAVRIMPGLTVNVLFMVLLGALVTTVSTSEYFGSQMTREFLFRNIFIAFNDPLYTLPGVFENNPGFGVNGSLWTLPYEISLYFVIGLLFFCARSATIRIVALSICLALSFSLMIFEHYNPAANYSFRVWNWLTTRPFGVCGLLFFTGAIVGLTSQNRSILSIAQGIIAVCIFLAWGGTTLVSAYLLLAIATICAGESKILRLPHKFGDISYGVYLYAFPIQQAAIHFLGTDHFVASYVVALALTIACASISWWLIEKPMMRLKDSFSFGRRRTAIPSGAIQPVTVSVAPPV